MVRNAIHNAFVVPVRKGRVRLEDLPRATRISAVAAYVVYALLVVSVLLSGPLANIAPGRDSMGLLTAGSVSVALGFWTSLVLLFLASLHLPLWTRLGAWLLLGLTHAATWFMLYLSMLVRAQFLPALAAVGSILSGLVVLGVVAGTSTRRDPTMQTLLGGVAGMGLTWLAPYLLAEPLRPETANTMSVLALVFTVLALPLAVAAGTAFAQITVNLTTSSLVAVRARLPRHGWRVVAVVAALVVIGLGVYRAWLVGPAAVGFTAIQTFLGLGLTVAALLAARGRGSGEDTPPRPYAMTEVLADVSMVLGLAIGSWGVPLVISHFLPVPVVFSTNMSVWSDLLMAVFALVMLVRAILRGRTLLVLLLPSMLVMGVLAGARSLAGWPSLSNGVASGLLALVVLGAVVVWRRRMDPLRWFLVSVALVVLAVFPYRQEVAEPLEALLGSSQVVVLLIGLVWLLLTEAEFTHGATPKYGRVSRVMVFLAYALSSASMVAALAHADSSSALMELNLSELAGIGDAIMGYAFAPAVVVGIILLGRRGLDVIPPQVRAGGRTTGPGASTARR